MPAPDSIGAMLCRAAETGLLCPDPLDFVWRWSKEAPPRRGAAESGWARWIGGVPDAIRPDRDAVAREWRYALDLMFELRFALGRGSGRHRHVAITPGFDAYADLPRVPACPPLALCEAKPPWREIGRRRFDSWAWALRDTVLHEVAEEGWRPPDLIVVPVAGLARIRGPLTGSAS